MALHTQDDRVENLLLELVAIQMLNMSFSPAREVEWSRYRDIYLTKALAISRDNPGERSDTAPETKDPASVGTRFTRAPGR